MRTNLHTNPKRLAAKASRPDSDHADSSNPEYNQPEKTGKAFVEDESGTTTLEWLMLLGVIALPTVYIFTVSLATIVDYYRMMTTLNSLPFP